MAYSRADFREATCYARKNTSFGVSRTQVRHCCVMWVKDSILLCLIIPNYKSYVNLEMHIKCPVQQLDIGHLQTN